MPQQFLSLLPSQMWQMAGPGSQRMEIGSLAAQAVLKVHLVEGCGAKNGVLIK